MNGHEGSGARRAGRPLLSMALLAGMAAVAVTIAYPAAARRGKTDISGHERTDPVAAVRAESAGATPRLVFSTRTVVYAGRSSRVGGARAQAIAPVDEAPKFEGYITYPR